MTVRQLQTAITDSGINMTHFFNGRLLSSEDLIREQDANQEARYLLGKALGDGIVHGLDVSHEPEYSGPNQTVVRVKKGLAVNRNGRVIEIKDDLFLNLERNDEEEATAEEFFVPCSDYKANGATYVAGAGLYLLAMTPVEVRRGRAIVNGLRNSAVSCNQKTITEGVQFRLISLELTGFDLSALDKLRNQVAYRFFGVQQAEYSNFFADPFGPQDGYGWLDSLHGSRLFNCDIPLAVVFWTAADGLVFVDNWAVRRGLTTQNNRLIPFSDSNRRQRESEAMMMQFQEQLQIIRLERNFNTQFVQARQYFRHLPPMGMIPLASTSRPIGFDAQAFFHDIVVADTYFIEGARLQFAANMARDFPPIDLDATLPGTAESESNVALRIYEVRENRQDDSQQAYLVFTSGHMPDISLPHYDVNRWNYANPR